MKFRKLGWNGAALFLLGTSFTFAQQTAPAVPPAQKPGEKAPEPAKEAEKKPPPPEDKVVQTKHSARIGGQEIKYTATAGMLVMKAEDGGASFLVWTTTPWTLPANLAIAVHPEVTYALVLYRRAGQHHLGVAKLTVPVEHARVLQGVSAPTADRAGRAGGRRSH